MREPRLLLTRRDRKKRGPDDSHESHKSSDAGDIADGPGPARMHLFERDDDGAPGAHGAYPLVDEGRVMPETVGDLVAVFLGLTALWFLWDVLIGGHHQRRGRSKPERAGRLTRH